MEILVLKSIIIKWKYSLEGSAVDLNWQKNQWTWRYINKSMQPKGEGEKRMKWAEPQRTVGHL